MINKSKIIALFAAALLAGTATAEPAFAQHHGGGAHFTAGGAMHMSSGGGPRFSGAAGHWSGGRSGPNWGGRSFNGGSHSAFNGRHGHRHRHFVAGVPSWWGAYAYDYGPYPYDYYYDDDYGPDCHVRHVRIHHHWVWRRYCY
jgi:hypothetical protein